MGFINVKSGLLGGMLSTVRGSAPPTIPALSAEEQAHELERALAPYAEKLTPADIEGGAKPRTIYGFLEAYGVRLEYFLGHCRRGATYWEDVATLLKRAGAPESVLQRAEKEWNRGDGGYP